MAMVFAGALGAGMRRWHAEAVELSDTVDTAIVPTIKIKVISNMAVPGSDVSCLEFLRKNNNKKRVA